MPADFKPTDALIEKINRAFAKKPPALHDLLHLYGAADEKNFAPVIAFIVADTQEMQHRAGPHPFSNADLIYTGTSNDFALNDGVKRYHADAKSAAYVAKWYTPTGNLTRPMLALHDSGDPLVPASTAFEYAMTAQRAGHGDNFVQQYVNHEGHCVFTPAEIGTAFDELVKLGRFRQAPGIRKAAALALYNQIAHARRPALGARVRGGHRDVILRGQRPTRTTEDVLWLLFGVYQKVTRWPQDSGSF